MAAKVAVSDVVSLLSGDKRDFLLRNNGDKVAISSLDGKVVGLYFSASWCRPRRRFTPLLIEVYDELSSKGQCQFEIVIVPADHDEDSFDRYFSKMPWLAIPFADSNTRKKLDMLFRVGGIPHLVILDASGKVLNEQGIEAVREYGAEGYPFTPEKINRLREEEEEAAKKEQSLPRLLVSPSRDYLISNDGSKHVAVSDLEGKIVVLYFSIGAFTCCAEFTPVLAQIYRKLKEARESFEVVLVSLDDEKSSYEQDLASMPWLAIPFEDKNRQKLGRCFDVRANPALVVIGADGKTMDVNYAELVEEHGFDAWEAFPFSQERLDLMAEKAKAKMDAQTLEYLLVSGDLDYVIGKQGSKVPVKELVGATILLYFSACWCGRYREFAAGLIEEYQKIKSMDSSFEMVFISSDRDQDSFEEFFSGMPWLALPFGDERRKYFSRTFRVRGIPSLVAIGPTGRTLTKDARNLLTIHGADAYPFSEERIKELEQKIEEMAKGWPEKVKRDLHGHELVLTRCKTYCCDGCGEMGSRWSYSCIGCNVDFHPKCALKEEKKEDEDEGRDGRIRV
ncbi:unnamed protein product [Musa banksii]